MANHAPTENHTGKLAWITLAVLAIVSMVVLFLGWNPGALNQQYLGNLLDRFFPADFQSLSYLLKLIFETLAMALMGTSVGFLLAIPLAALASNRITTNPVLRTIGVSLAAFFRAVPDLVFALIAVVVFGFGYLAGAIALATATTGMLAKLFAEIFDKSFDRAALPVRSIGVSSGQLLFAVVIRANLKALISLAIYRLDINFRSATTLGLVGAGGIGLALKTSIGSLDYQSATAVVLLITGFVILFEFISGFIRKSIESPGPLSTFTPPFLFVSLSVSTLVFVAFLIHSLVVEDRITDSLSAFLMPDFSSFSETVLLTGESLAMSFFGVFIAFVFGSSLGIVSSKKANLVFVSRALGKSVIVLIRSVPTIVYALLLTVAFGLGPQTGAIALAIASVGIMAKLTLDSFDSQSSVSLKPLTAIGLSKKQVLFGGTLREHLSLLISNTSFVFDVAFRYSLILGIVGAGGLGSLLLEALRIYDYGRVTVIVLVIFAVIYSIEALTKKLNREN